jgi:hypothetical protein
LILALLLSFFSKANTQSLDFTAASCASSGSISITITGPGGGAPYTYHLTGCGTSITQPGQPASYTFTGLPLHNCFTTITVTDNAGVSVSKPVYMPNIISPGVVRVYTYPCGPGNYVVIPVGGYATGANPLYTIYATDGVTILYGPQSSNVFPAVASVAGDNFVVGIKRFCGGESFTPVTLATSTAIIGAVNCACILDAQTSCSALPDADFIDGAAYTWTSPGGIIYNHRQFSAYPPENGTWQLSATLVTAGCTYTLTNTLQLMNCIAGTVPVKYTSLRARSSHCKTTIEWSTAQEDNTDRFEIETSSNGHTDWLKAATTGAAGYSGSNQPYRVTIPSGDAPVLFIRIKQIDKDGRFTYSMVVKVDVVCNDRIRKLTVSPNPILQHGSLGLQLQNSAPRGMAYILLTDISGKPCLTKAVSLLTGMNRYDLTLAGFPQGIYLAKMVSADGNWQSNTVKVVIH